VEIGSTWVKQKSILVHKGLIKVIKKGNVGLIDSINHIHEVNIQIEDKQF